MRKWFWYWLSYANPVGIWALNRQWVVRYFVKEYDRLAQLQAAEVEHLPEGVKPKVLQVGLTFGDQTEKLADAVAARGGTLALRDICSHECNASERRLRKKPGVSIGLHDVTEAVAAGDRNVDIATMFFLLHELPHEGKVAALQNMLKALNPDAAHRKLVVVEFGKPEGQSHADKKVARFHDFVFNGFNDPQGERKWWKGGFEPFASEMTEKDAFERLLKEAVQGLGWEPGDWQVSEEKLAGGMYRRYTVEPRRPPVLSVVPN